MAHQPSPVNYIKFKQIAGEIYQNYMKIDLSIRLVFLEMISYMSFREIPIIHINLKPKSYN